MHLSQLVLNPRSRQVRRELAEPYEMHRTLMKAFADAEAGGPGRVLMRLDAQRETGQLTLLVQSDREPDWSRLTVQNDYFVEPVQKKSVDLRFAVGQRLRFRVRANPTVKHGSGSREDRQMKRPGRHGRREALLTEELQRNWLERKAKAGGFRVLGVQVVPEGWVTGEKANDNGRHEMKFFAVRFDGVLEVTDPAKFLETVRQGIGSAKGFGFGLLSLAQVS